MTKQELIQILNSLPIDGDLEENHQVADRALLTYINDEDIKEAFERVDKWYA